jgi:hypothetical protein
MSKNAESVINKVVSEYPQEVEHFFAETIRGVTFIRYEFCSTMMGLDSIEELADAEISFNEGPLTLFNTLGYVKVSMLCDSGVLLIDLIHKSQVEAYINLGFNSEEDLCI